MSHIFDALQRAESDRKGTPPHFSNRATELLERAEAQAVSAWQVAVLSESSEVAAADGGSPGRNSWPDNGEHGRSVSAAKIAPDSPDEFWRGFPELQPTISPESRLVTVQEKATPAAEAFRLLAVRLRHMKRDRTLRRVLITSTTPQEGKSLISANIACALAQVKSQKVLVIEGDLRRPSLTKVLGVQPTSGLAECLQSDLDAQTSIYRIIGTGTYVLPAGKAPANPLELLQSPKLPALMDRVSNWFDWVIIDTPPVLPLADTSIWARMADGILMVTRQGTTEKRKLERGLDALDASKLIGAVLNSSTGAVEKDYYYYGRQTGAAADLS